MDGPHQVVDATTDSYADRGWNSHLILRRWNSRAILYNAPELVLIFCMTEGVGDGGLQNYELYMTPVPQKTPFRP